MVSDIVDQTFNEINDYKGENSQSLLKSEIVSFSHSFLKGWFTLNVGGTWELVQKNQAGGMRFLMHSAIIKPV